MVPLNGRIQTWPLFTVLKKKPSPSSTPVNNHDDKAHLPPNRENVDGAQGVAFVVMQPYCTIRHPGSCCCCSYTPCKVARGNPAKNHDQGLEAPTYRIRLHRYTYLPGIWLLQGILSWVSIFSPMHWVSTISHDGLQRPSTNSSCQFNSIQLTSLDYNN